MQFRYQHVALGGTFDLLHKGHRKLLFLAFENGHKVSIGLTTNQMVATLNKAAHQNYQIREKELVTLLYNHNLNKRARIIPLNDIYGSTLTDPSIEALVVSNETLSGANSINKKRAELNLKKLEIIVCPTILATDRKPITSGRVRTGHISRKGHNYLSLLKKIANKRFSEEIRQKLKKPFGKVIKLTEKQLITNYPIITIGDISTKEVLRLKRQPDIAIVDFMVARRKKFNSLQSLGFQITNPDFRVVNPPGLLSRQALDILAKALNTKRKSIIKVSGEEDLITLAAILLAPLGTLVFYGQPHQGQVMVEVTEKIKEKVCRLFKLV